MMSNRVSGYMPSLSALGLDIDNDAFVYLRSYDILLISSLARVFQS